MIPEINLDMVSRKIQAAEQERDRLKAVNAELVKILQAIVTCEDEGDTELYDRDMDDRSTDGASPFQSSQLGNAMAEARAVLAKARKED